LTLTISLSLSLSLSLGVKRILPLSVFPDFGEKWESIRLLLDRMDYQTVADRCRQTFLCADLKVILVLIGQQSTASTHPCPYCLMSKDHFACNVPLHNCPNRNPLLQRVQQGPAVSIFPRTV
jgi:hypothetical protein